MVEQKLLKLFIVFCEVSCEVTALGKHKVANTRSKAYSQEQPAIERHDNQHQDVAITNLNHMQHRLEEVHA